MKACATVTAVMALGLATAMAGCSDEGDQDNRVYSISDIEGFRPEIQGLEYEDPFSQTAGEAWESGWPDDLTISFEPAECRTYETSSRFFLLETDESQTADDSIVRISGSLADDSLGTDVYVFMHMRVFSSPSSAGVFMSGLQSSAALCANGYNEQSPTLIYTVDSIDVSEVDLPGVGNVLVHDERNWSGGRVDEPESLPIFDHVTRYVYIQGNVVFIASYSFNGSVVTEDDATELIGQFIEHLG
jgi:hypothetical protein